MNVDKVSLVICREAVKRQSKWYCNVFQEIVTVDSVLLVICRETVKRQCKWYCC